jgi:hypothetical protein
LKGFVLCLGFESEDEQADGFAMPYMIMAVKEYSGKVRNFANTAGMLLSFVLARMSTCLLELAVWPAVAPCDTRPSHSQVAALGCVSLCILPDFARTSLSHVDLSLSLLAGRPADVRVQINAARYARPCYI